MVTKDLLPKHCNYITLWRRSSLCSHQTPLPPWALVSVRRVTRGQLVHPREGNARDRHQSRVSRQSQFEWARHLSTHEFSLRQFLAFVLQKTSLSMGCYIAT